MSTWQLQEAKAQFSSVVKQALSKGPQEITVHGKPAVVLISQALYEKLSHATIPFVDFMQQSPLKGVKLNIKRDRSLTREIDL